MSESRSAVDQSGPANAEFDQPEGIEYLTRGPLHEAFAEPYEANPEPSPLVAKQPPEPIDEVPPQYRPDGEDVIWIPGYWAWDDERDDFIWVSGVWRDLPPGQQWVPGYWDRTSEGFRYVGGFWVSNKLAEVEYLPPPPESLEQGPSSPAPGENHFYIPGNWVYDSADYQWQPGFWSAAHQNWVWVPAQYVWTPRGCVYQTGYWDYDVPQRGVLFTPVYYQQPVYRNAGYSYRPRYTIDTGVGLFVHLFVRPNHRHYYFGDYYGPQYSNSYQPWVTRYQGQQYYDPFYANYSYRSRTGSGNNLVGWIANQFQSFATNDRYRPARTIAGQRDFFRSNRDAQIDPTILRLTALGDSIENLVGANDSDVNFRRLGRNEVDRVRGTIDPLRQLGRNRLEIEGSSNAKINVDKNTRVDREGVNSSTRIDAELDASAKADPQRDANPNDKSRVDLNARSSVRNRISDDNRGPLRLPNRDRSAATATDATEAARERVNRVKDNASDQLDDVPVDRLDGIRPRRGDAFPKAGNSEESIRGNDRVPERLGRDAGEAARRANRVDELRPTRPESWPSQRLPEPSRVLPNLPGSKAAGNQPATPLGIDPLGRNSLPGKAGGGASGRTGGSVRVQPDAGSPAPNAGRVGNPGRAVQRAAEPVAPAAKGALKNATEGVKGGGKAVKKAIGGALGDK